MRAGCGGEGYKTKGRDVETISNFQRLNSSLKTGDAGKGKLSYKMVGSFGLLRDSYSKDVLKQRGVATGKGVGGWNPFSKFI